VVGTNINTKEVFTFSHTHTHTTKIKIKSKKMVLKKPKKRGEKPIKNNRDK